MPKIETGLSPDDVEELGAGGDFDPLPDGEYEVTCTDIELTVTGPDAKTPGTPMIKWTFDVINDADFAGRKLWSNTVINNDKKSNFGLANILKALEVETDGKGSFDSEDCLGQSALAIVVQDEYNGKINNKIKRLVIEE